MNKYRTHNCSELNEKNIGIKIKLSGWIHRKRDHGNLLFHRYTRPFWYNPMCNRK